MSKRLQHDSDDGQPKRRKISKGATFRMSAMSDDEEDPGWRRILLYHCYSTSSDPATASTLQRTRGAFTFAWNSHGTEAEAQPIPPPFHRMVSETLPDPTLIPCTNPPLNPQKNSGRCLTSRSDRRASVAISGILPLLPKIQQAILATFTHTQIGTPCDCGDANVIFRCVECFNAPLWCRRCIIMEHRYNPFHHVEKWDGRRFARDSLNVEAGQLESPMQTHLASKGHLPCPNANPKRLDVRDFTIIDHNGFHNRRLQFCGCSRSVLEAWQQLIAVRLFPATFKQPRTAFTFTALKQFHIHSLTSKKSAYDYMKALCKLTDNASPDTITDRYREFLFACRIWRYLALERRSGQAHGIDAYVPHRRAGSLTVRCPACPETYRDVIRFDRCNFKLQRKNKRDDPNDFALNDGRSYFVESEDYKSYLKVAKPVEELGTCSHLRAARMQNLAKFKNAVISGVVAVQCARHSFYLPQGMVDLTKGEAFANTDYALCFSMGEAQNLRWIRFTYDIWCHYGVKLAAHVEQLFPSMSSIVAKIVGAIPKMHILNHIERCQLEWNLNWLSYCGFTVGEMIETGWGVHNLTAGSTKEMNAGHRHDVVDDTSNNWNWRRCLRLVSATLVRLYRLAVFERRKRTANFEDVDADHRRRYGNLVVEWERWTSSRELKSGKFIVFSSQISKAVGPPTHAAAYEKLLKAEVDAEERLRAKHEAADRSAERTRQAPRPPVVPADIVAQRVDGSSQTSRHSKSANSASTRILQAYGGSRSGQARRHTLVFTIAIQWNSAGAMKLEAMMQVEYSLREGQAYDALGSLRTAIRTYNYNLHIKKTDIHGVGATTRGQNFLKVLSNDIQSAGDDYRRTRAALVRLGLPQRRRDAQTARAERRSWMGRGGKQWHWDIRGRWILGFGDDEARRNDGGRRIEVGDRKEGAQANVMVYAVDRVKWFRDRALKCRSDEEVETLEAEFARVIESFRHNSEDIWAEIASQEDGETGWRVYAYKQAAMYDKLSQDCAAEWARAPSLVLKDQKDEEEKARRDAIEAAKQGGATFTTDYSLRLPNRPLKIGEPKKAIDSVWAEWIPRRLGSRPAWVIWTGLILNLGFNLAAGFNPKIVGLCRGRRDYITYRVD
ncbi:hypothetical protein B0H13DRAFT_1866198 [Mycena leptocephala]|nr:hypothetical protein B0H13DRAFT_1866198 [Mycena leptocephala]